MRLTLDWNPALDSVDRGQDLFRENWDHSLVFQDFIKFLEDLIMYYVQNACSTAPDG